MPKTKQAVEQAAQLKIYIPQLDRFEAKLLEWTAQDKFQAMVIKVMRYGAPIFEGCYGKSTNEYGVHMDTIFPIFSNTKPIIGTLFMILQEEGNLEMDDPVSRFLPEYDHGGWEKIHIWHLLTHTSGFTDGELEEYINEYVKDELKIKRPDDNSPQEDWKKYDDKIKKALGLPEDTDIWKALSLRVKLKRPPRDKSMSYCNHGYSVLTDVLCAAAGESIDSYAQRVLFEPLGMVDTHWILPKEKWGRVLGRNERCVGHGYINSEELYKSESGVGGLKSTVIDMSNFAQMILGEGRYNNQRILSPASVREMGKNQNETHINQWDAWGLGWNYRSTKVDDAGTLRSARSLEHGGWAGHRILVDREYGLSVIMYMGEYNDSYGDFGRINNMIVAALE
ncbi:MAG: beta-lactamase family protein [Oscillospiraceae bacterium]|nr:beta-lactamase family protein [Oscillospiraceae bacterium]